MILTTPIKWVDQMIRKHSRITDSFETEMAYYTWLGWAITSHYVVTNDPPTYVIIARPVSWEIWETCPKGEELWVVDHNGDALWMDFLWAPSQWDRVTEFLEHSGKRWGGWEHRTTGKVHIVDIHKLTKKRLVPSTH